MNILENALTQVNTFLDKKNIQKLEKTYDEAFAESVKYRSRFSNMSDMNFAEKIRYSNLMYEFENAKFTLLEYTRKKNVKSDMLYIAPGDLAYPS